MKMKIRVVSGITFVIYLMSLFVFPTEKVMADGNDTSMVCQIYSDYLHWEPYNFFNFVWDDKNQIISDDNTFMHSGTASKHVKFLGGQAGAWVIDTDKYVDLTAVGNTGYLSFWLYADELPNEGNTSLTFDFGSGPPEKFSQAFNITDIYTLGSGWKRIIIPLSK